jgi:hypothetical protein
LKEVVVDSSCSVARDVAASLDTGALVGKIARLEAMLLLDDLQVALSDPRKGFAFNRDVVRASLVIMKSELNGRLLHRK